MKAAVVCLLVLVAMATVEAGPMKKRFLIKEIQNAINSVSDWFTKTYNSAKDSFNKLASGINFDAAVNALIPYISSDMTVTACVGACKNAATTVLGPAASLAGSLCTPLCDGALAKLEDIAG
ncbi:conotoxin [Elysia marginata]|uniref:Conotoxin n=1 Tax=Elysia marginata TaxID=1093978 RepID=A0AAV4G340_9GAST|nr:conotoxin [Elysia marginata]